MAMRPDVRRHTIVIIVFSLTQWGIMYYIIHNELMNLTTHQRILYFCISSLATALLVFVSLIYMVLKGNADKQD
ncbi:hypothetical protein [Acinetobacter junii]|uniref:hypothetical protein n=1 Tax=Acinetobacter junii TaxID=40215 RepID=UPI0024AD800F|nr:hypothetical protein [Acinetobacter junii]MDI6621233.1 hypothetical protein [Acinetobacter junii]